MNMWSINDVLMQVTRVADFIIFVKSNIVQKCKIEDTY